MTTNPVDGMTTTTTATTTPTLSKTISLISSTTANNCDQITANHRQSGSSSASSLTRHLVVVNSSEKHGQEHFSVDRLKLDESSYSTSLSDQLLLEQYKQQQKPYDVFVNNHHDHDNRGNNCDEHANERRHLFEGHQFNLQRQQRKGEIRRSSLPVDAIELPTLTGVVMRRKQQLQLRYQQQQAPQDQQELLGNNGNHHVNNKHLLHPQMAIVNAAVATTTTTTMASNGRPLSISSISSAASSGSSSSANSSASSGVQSSFTRNGSLNYGHEYRKAAYLASIESLNNPTGGGGGSSAAAAQAAVNDSLSIQAALRNLNLTPSGQFKDAAARAAVLAAGAQSRAFASGLSPGGNSNGSATNQSPLRRGSLHASLRYDKSTAYRIHLLASARSNSAGTGGEASPDMQNQQPQQTGGSVSRNNSSTSSDSGSQSRMRSVTFRNTRIVCRCSTVASHLTSSSSASQVDQASTSDGHKGSQTDQETGDILPSMSNKAATLDGATCQRASNIQHHPECFFSKMRPLTRGSSKLQPSPSSASSHSHSSSLFRDDGFEDDLTSQGSEHLSSTSHHHHRLSFQGKLRIHHEQSSVNRLSVNGHQDDEDDYQSCEEEFSNSRTTASTASNLDDCALSTTSSSIVHHPLEQPNLIDKISLANAKQQYRRSLLLEHHQHQQYLQNNNSNGAGSIGQSKIQALLSTSPSRLLLSSSSRPQPSSPLSPSANQSANTSISSSTTSGVSGCTSPTSGGSCSHNHSQTTPTSKQLKCDDRTVNIIGHMPTKSPGYWDSNLSISQRVVTEIIETERAYVDDLEQIVTGYICYLRNVLKQQKHQQHQQQLSTERRMSRQHQQQVASKLRRQSIDSQGADIGNKSESGTQMNDEDDKSILIYDDDMTTSAINEMEDYEVEETDNEIRSSKTMDHGHQLPQVDQDGAIMTANVLQKLFSNLEDIYKFNKDLLFRLEECYLNPSSVAECFVENASGFEVYTHYCTMYPQVVSTLTELMGNQKSAQLLKERQNELNQSLPLGAYLLKPVQRILKYHILFQSLIKHTVDDESVNEKDRQLINEAFSVMTNIACHINSMKKRHEHAIRVQEVQGLLSGWQGPDLTTLGELILEDTFRLYNRPKTSRHLFLFDNVLLITKKKRDGSLCYKGHIACNNLMLIENIVGQPLVFNTVPFDNPKALCAFQAKTLDKKRDWCLQMKEVIIKSFEVKIPVHVRDILMSLTNSSSNATDTGTKSSPSDTGKAIKAPNYLEKKRLKQEKKR